MKLTAKNHQYLGVNSVVEEPWDIEGIESGETGCLLAYPRLRKEYLHDLLRPEGAEKDTGELDGSSS